MTKKQQTLQALLHEEERKLLRDALERNGWVMLRAARTLGMAFSSFQRAISRHPGLSDELASKGRRPGRPPWKRKQ